MDQEDRACNLDYVQTPLSRLLANPISPFGIPVLLWITAWYLQSHTSQLVAAPLGLDVIYFTLGARVFSILIFGFRGVVGTLLGALVTFTHVGSPQYQDPVWFLLTYSLINTLCVYAVILSTEHYLAKRSYSLAPSLRSVLVIMVVSSVTVTLIHEMLFRVVAPTPVVYGFSLDSVALQVVSRVVGGMLFTLFIVLLAKLFLSEGDDRNSNLMIK
jgi:hypothetical protein